MKATEVTIDTEWETSELIINKTNLKNPSQPDIRS
ncbi:MAG: hypothetical protein CM1200mP22_05270 [Dehalococcoidia bacterium]|nr:MAG: hypothetical protein CM1200mP22_05270 [Dehalococcoidia bacterium]